MAVNPLRYYTPEEYLTLERAANHKSEYINGQIYAMAGASREHNVIATNISREVSLQLKGRPCETYSSDMRVNVVDTRQYSYPDVTVVCGEPEFTDAHVDTLTNPTVIFEVLSPSTEAYDRGAKFSHYRRLTSLTDYILVAQDRASVVHYTLEAGRWVFQEYNDLADILAISSIQCNIPLREIYDRVTFNPQPPPPEARMELVEESA
jgi:Uma2 family endonuclease